MNYFALDMTWQNLILHLMKRERASDYAIAARIGVSQPTIHRILKGKTKKPNAATIKLIEEAFKISINDDNPENVSFSSTPPMSVRDNTSDYQVTIIDENKLSLLKKLEEHGVNTPEELDRLLSIENALKDVKDIFESKIKFIRK